jgi:protein-disulfide isomerase
MRTKDRVLLSGAVGPRDHAQGPASAPITLVEYGDYECPHCARAHPIVKQLQRLLGSDLRVVFRNFPLTNIHAHAQHAAESAEGAGAQGRFWEMHDTLFKHQRALDDDSLAGYAAMIGLDTDRFRRELAGHLHGARVREDVATGVRSGVNGTPTFFINGVRHDGGWELEMLQAAILKVSDDVIAD